MTKHTARLTALRALLGIVALLLVGCATYTPIKPTELPKLNDSFTAPMGSVNGAQLVAVRVAQVQRPDGRLVEIKGDFDVRITLVDGTSYAFTHPVRSRLDPTGTMLGVAGGNRPEAGFPLASISEVQVSQANAGGAIAIGGLVAAGALVLVLAVAH